MPPTSTPVTTYWTRSPGDTDAFGPEPLLCLPDELARGEVGGRDGEGLAALPLHDDRRRADAAPPLVVANAPRRERGGRGTAREIELRDRLTDGLRVRRLRPFRRFLDDPHVRVRHERVLRHERLARPLLESLDEIVLALERMRGEDRLDVVEQLRADRLHVLRRDEPRA